jgi:thymidylate synthase (FAD)
MPMNNSLQKIKKPVEFKEGPATTDFIEQITSIEVKLLNAPSIEDLMSYIPSFSLATWEDKPRNDYTSDERKQSIEDLFNGHLLPNAMETIGLTFLISNMDLIDVTHLLRHRSFSFSAHCTADRDMRNDSAMVKPSILFHKEFLERYIEITNAAKQLYADMVDSKDISILDARTILPRNLESHYYMKCNIKDVLGFIRQRLDRQIQPMSDNIIALKMWIEIVKKYPMIKSLIDVDAKDQWYINTAPTGRNSNIYRPEEKNDTFEWNEQWFLYDKKRNEFLGSSLFESHYNSLLKELEEIK